VSYVSSSFTFLPLTDSPATTNLSHSLAIPRQQLRAVPFRSAQQTQHHNHNKEQVFSETRQTTPHNHSKGEDYSAPMPNHSNSSSSNQARPCSVTPRIIQTFQINRPVVAYSARLRRRKHNHNRRILCLVDKARLQVTACWELLRHKITHRISLLYRYCT
jgi:hypothetical protein